MKKNIILFTTIFLFTFSPIVFANKPAQNSLGICDVWFSKDSVDWENTTAFTSLKLGEPFYVKVWIKAKTDLNSMSYHMSCYGPPFDFELMQNPKNLPDNAKLYDFDLSTVGDITFWKPKAYDEHTLIWKLCVKPDSDFKSGKVPLNIDFEFFGEEIESFYFTVVSVNIVNETWPKDILKDTVEISSAENNYELSNIAPDVEMMFVLFFLILITFLIKRK